MAVAGGQGSSPCCMFLCFQPLQRPSSSFPSERLLCHAALTAENAAGPPLLRSLRENAVRATVVCTSAGVSGRARPSGCDTRLGPAALHRCVSPLAGGEPPFMQVCSLLLLHLALSRTELSWSGSRDSIATAQLRYHREGHPAAQPCHRSGPSCRALAKLVSVPERCLAGGAGRGVSYGCCLAGTLWSGP